MTFPVIEAPHFDAQRMLRIDVELTCAWLEAFLRDEFAVRRGIGRAVIALSGGVDSAVVA